MYFSTLNYVNIFSKVAERKRKERQELRFLQGKKLQSDNQIALETKGLEQKVILIQEVQSLNHNYFS